MKKIYFLLLTLLISTVSFGQDLVLTGIFDGPLTGGTPKLIELYVINDIPDLSVYGIESANNGSAAAGVEYTFPAEARSSGSYIYLGYEGTNAGGFNTYFGVSVTYLDNVANNNGDDAVILYQNGTPVDVFGAVGTDGTGEAWDSVDGWAYRNDSTGPDGTTFSLASWSFSGVDATDGCTTNASCASVFPIGTYSATASTSPTVALSGAVSGLDYFAGSGPSAENTVTVSGTNLTADVTVTAPTNFEVSLTSGNGFSNSVSVAQTAGQIAATTIYVRLAAGLAENTYTGDATASSNGASNATVSLSGTVFPATPQITINGTVGLLNYTLGNGPSPEDSFDVSGLFLTTSITVEAPPNFEVSLTSGSGFGTTVVIPQTGGSAANTTVYVRLVSGLAINSYSGDITASATGAPNQILSVTGNVFGASSNSMVITGIFDGPLTGGTPKLIEFYVISDIADLSTFGIESANNGAAATGVEFTFPAEPRTAGSYVYLGYEGANTGNINTYFGIDADFLDNSANNNGDDAIILYENDAPIDNFGAVGTDGTGEPWDTLDGWAYRNDGTGPDGAAFVIENWSFSGVDATDACTTNTTCASIFPIGTYSTTLSVDESLVKNFKIFPNPTSLGYVTISSNKTDRMLVSVYDVLGKKVLDQTVTNNRLNLASLKSGIYIMKISQNNTTVTKKLVIK